MNIRTRKEFHFLLKEYNCTVGIELGVSGGKYSQYLLDNYNFNAFYSVDSWNSRAHLVSQYMSAYNRLKKYNNTYIYRATFEEVLPMFEDEYFDFIYIDGYASSNNDSTIEQWYPKLKVGGIYSGHDYDYGLRKPENENRFLTQNSVDELCKKYNKQLNLTSSREDCPDWNDKYQSWWIIK